MSKEETTLAATHRPPEAGTPQAGTLQPDATPASEKNLLTPTAAETAERRGFGGGPCHRCRTRQRPQEPRCGPAKPATGLQARACPDRARAGAPPVETPSVDASPRRCAARRPPSSPRKLRRASLRRRSKEWRRSSPPDATAPRGCHSAGEEEISPPLAPPKLCPTAPAGGGSGGEEGGGCLDGLGFPPLPSPTGARAGATKMFLFEPLRLYESSAF
jgi:hypothetical protein